MDSYPGDFPFGIMDVVELLHLRIRRRQANSVYVDCPFCGDRRGKMNVNFVKNVWRCNHCDEHGGMLALYAELNHTTTSDACVLGDRRSPVQRFSQGTAELWI